jgi:serine/threonine-protein kinase HipA
MSDPRLVEVADVYKKDWLAGRILRRDDVVEFSYSAEYLQSGRPAVAHTLPLGSGSVMASGGAVPAFFAGLLPEGARLTALARRLKTSGDDMLSLLLAVGGDTVGDVRVLPAGAAPADPAALVRAGRWEDEDFGDLFSKSVGLDPEGADRVAIPGVQVKVSAEMISLAVMQGASRWLLKLEPEGYPRLLENEAFFLAMAGHCGLRVPDAEIVRDRAGRPGLLVRRFDRVEHGGDVLRLAQEDACQLLGRYPADKYRLPYRDVARGVLEVSTIPAVDALELVVLAAFSYLVGNGDLHAKNVSAGETTSGDVRLTPAYDLLSTLAYVGDDPMALRIDGRDRNLRRPHLVEFGGRLGVRERALARALDRMCDVVPAWIARIPEIGLDERVTARLQRELARRLDDLAAR